MYSDPFFLLIELNRERVVALSKLAAWTVKESADYSADSLADAALPKPENEYGDVAIQRARNRSVLRNRRGRPSLRRLR
jgi:hypothetical protein